jgi:hypothetical protein
VFYDVQVFASKHGHKGAKWTLSEEGIPTSAFDHTCCERTHLRSSAKGRFKRRSSQLASHTIALAGPMIPSLPAMRHGGYLRSNVECMFEHLHHCVRTYGLRSNADS